ncbi:MAG TPA: hypothetical protein VF699_06790 [Caulobacteraceae bacterium]
MTPVALFQQRTLQRRDWILYRFRVLSHYMHLETFYVDAAIPEDVSLTPRNHSVRSTLDLSERFHIVFGVELLAAGVLPDGEVLAAENILPETDEFSVSYRIVDVDHQRARVTIEGTFKRATSLEIDYLRSAAHLRVFGVAKEDLPVPYYKQAIGDALSLQLEERENLSFFTYMTALDAMINFQLGDLKEYSEISHCVTRLQLEEKFRLALKRVLNTRDVGAMPLVSRLLTIFGESVDKRNAIAHSLKPITITKLELDEVCFTYIAFQMMVMCGSSDLPELTDYYDLRAVMPRKYRIPLAR